MNAFFMWLHLLVSVPAILMQTTSGAAISGGLEAGIPIVVGGNLASQCSDGIDNDGDGLIDWYGNDTGGGVDAGGLHGDPGCPTPNWPLGECSDPECAPASNAPGIGLASISPAVPAWPGSFKTPGTGGCPSDNVLAANTVYSYCALASPSVSGDNVTCYGCRIRASGTSASAIALNDHDNFRLVYSRIEPTSDQTPPIPFSSGFEYGFHSDNQGFTWERSHILGFANAVTFNPGTTCNASHPCTFRGVFFDYPREDNGDIDHTDGPGCTEDPVCHTSYVTLTGCTMLGWQFGEGNNSNTNAIALQEGNPNSEDGYDHIVVTDNYFTGWNTVVTLEEGGVQNTNGLFLNNWYGSEYKLGNTLMYTWGSNGGSNLWAGNRFNYTSEGAWGYPAPTDDGKFWQPGDYTICSGGSNPGAQCSLANGDSNCTGGGHCDRLLLHAGDYNGNGQVPYSEPQCDDGLDNDGDGNIDYPWDSGCASASDTTEANTASFPTTWQALLDGHYYPGPTNTGVPAGTNLTNTSARSLNTAGITINGENVTGTAGGQTGYGLLVNANNITIKNTKITTSFGTGTSVNASAGIKIAPGVTGTRIENVEVDGSNATHACVWFEGAGPISVTALNCHNVCDGIFSWDGDNFSIIDSYIHDLSTAPSNGHTDGFQTEGAQHGTIRHNTIDIANSDTGLVSIWNSRRNSTDITVDDNLLSGAGFIFYAEDYDPSEGSPVGGFTTTAIHHTNNKISTAKRWSTGGGNSPTACAGYWGVYFHVGNAYNGGPTDGWDRSGNIVIETGGSVNTEIPGCG